MKRFLKWLFIVLLVLIVVYFFGPHPAAPVYARALPQVPADLSALETSVQQQEAALPVKPENEARIVWAGDSVKQKTPYAIVYLHGFSASQEEGDPVHTDIAKKYHCNLYLSRLYGHGLKDTVTALKDFTVDKFWESCKQAIAIGKQLGEKVIIMCTSTGGTAALKLAAEYPEIAGLVLLSPNVEINDGNAWLLNNPWGEKIAEFVKDGKYIYSSLQTEEYKKYWYHRYCISGAVELQEMIETSMTKDVFAKITQPLLLLYYYKDEQHQDPVVKVSAMKDMFAAVATPAAQKRAFALPEAGNHVLGSHVISKDIPTVEMHISDFLEQVMGLKAKS
jgi:pimeloyl-ACP methyl ester carboxylesterase